MAKKVLGKASYSATRIGGMVRLSASGQVAHWNDKTDFDALPFLIFPPIYGFYFIEQDISLPAVRPFTYEETISYPVTSKTVRIHDADGRHDVPIADIRVPDMDVAVEAGKVYCVYEWPGVKPLLIAKKDAILPAVYTKVFGPDAYKACQKYVKDNNGI